MRNKLSALSRFKVYYTAVLAFLVFFGMAVFADFSRLVSMMSFSNLLLLLQVCLLASTAYILRFLKWEYYLRRLEIDIPILDSFGVFLSGMMMVVTPGKMGEIWKAWLLEKEQGVEKRRTVVAVGADRLTDVISVSFLGFLGIFLVQRSLLTLILVFSILISGIMVLQWKGFCLRVISFLEGFSFIEGYAEELEDFYRDSYSLLQPGPLLIALFLSLVSWTLEGFGLWLVINTFQSGTGLMSALFLFGFASVIGAVSMLPGGLGAMEASMVGIMVGFGLTKTSAVASTLIFRAGTLWYGAFLGFIVFLFFSRRYRISEILQNFSD